MGNHEKRQTLPLLGSSPRVRRKRILHVKPDRRGCRAGGNVGNMRTRRIIGAHLDRIVGAVANQYPKIVCVGPIKPRQTPDEYAHVGRAGLKLEEMHVVTSVTTSA